MTRVIGIDLGTTNSCAAIWDAGRVTVIPNRAGYTTTPSVIAVAENGRVLIGQAAQRQAVTNPKHTAYAVKRLIGRAFLSEEVQHARAHVSYTIVPGPGGDPRILLREQPYTCPEISAMILTEMRVVAEDFLGETVDKAVVTVPAYFNDAQRQAVRDAGRIAGLDIVRIVNEPTAAALAYGYGRGLDKTVAVFDLGGGTFDVSIVRCARDGTTRVLATTGDSFLGGEDFDERIMGWLLDGFEAQHGVKVRQLPLVVQRVRDAAAKAKVELSATDVTELQLPHLVQTQAGPLHMHYQVSREALEALTHDLVQRTLDICAHALQSIKMAPSAVDEVVLVGGMTRMPLVERRVAEFFGRRPSKGVNPDEVVAIGAALQGASIAEQIDSVALEDVTSVAIGVALAGDRFGVLIPANSRVPASVTKRFTTSRDDQRSVRVRVLQGDSEKASENELLHEFEITGLRPGRAGSVTLSVTYAIDAEGMFHVTATDEGTGQMVRVEVKGDGGLSEQEVDKLAEDYKRRVEAERQAEVLAGLRQSAQTLASDVAKLAAKLEQLGLGHRPVVATARDRAAHVRAVLTSLDRSDLSEVLVEFEELRDQLGKLAGRR